VAAGRFGTALGQEPLDVFAGDVEWPAGLGVEEPGGQGALAPLQVQHLPLDGPERHQPVPAFRLIRNSGTSPVRNRSTGRLGRAPGR
jgi:hypothetical protein